MTYLHLLLLISCGLAAALIWIYWQKLGKTPASHSSFLDKINATRWNANLLLLFLMVGLAALFLFSYLASSSFLPEPASEHGVWVDDMFWGTTLITGTAFLLTQILLFYFAFRYQHRGDRKATFYPRNNKLEFTWTAVPTVVFFILNLFGFFAYQSITSTADDEAVVIEIVAQQFNWSARYPGADNQLGSFDVRLVDAVNYLGVDFTDPQSQDDFIPLQLHVPKGRQVLLKIRSRDVIHSVFMPHFRLKMDAVPGMPTRFHFVPRFTTEEMRKRLRKPDFDYELACAELCGRGHFAMRFVVVVDEEKDFWQWYRQQKPWLASHPEYRTPHTAWAANQKEQVSLMKTD